MLGTHYFLVYTKGRGEQSIDIQGEDNKKSGEGEGSGSKCMGDHDTGSKSQSGGNLANGEKGKEWLYRQVVSW